MPPLDHRPDQLHVQFELKTFIYCQDLDIETDKYILKKKTIENVEIPVRLPSDIASLWLLTTSFYINIIIHWIMSIVLYTACAPLIL